MGAEECPHLLGAQSEQDLWQHGRGGDRVATLVGSERSAGRVEDHSAYRSRGIESPQDHVLSSKSQCGCKQRCRFLALWLTTKCTDEPRGSLAPHWFEECSSSGLLEAFSMPPGCTKT